MDEWTCDGCKNKCVPVYAYPCCNCVDGSRYEPEEGSEDEQRNQTDHQT